ncbi:MAG TPA: Yip1 family protein [Gemmatimonadaceae bacterium]|nr:Yip1 family protein [Gemmatimonadaceae bacterium]
MTDAAMIPAPSKASLWEDFIDIFYQPAAVFDRRREGKFGLALVVLVVVCAVLYLALRNGLAPIMDAEMAKATAAMSAKNANLTSEQISSMTGTMEKFAVIGYVVFLPIGVLLTGAILWAVSRLVDAKETFAAAMMIATYSQIPRIVELVVNALQGLLLPPEQITSHYSVTLGVGRFLDPNTNPFVMTLLGGIDLFTIWTVVLMAIGLSVVAGIPRSKAAVAAVLVWLVGLIIPLIGALRQA